jgi:hypothetical protein
VHSARQKLGLTRRQQDEPPGIGRRRRVLAERGYIIEFLKKKKKTKTKKRGKVKKWCRSK